MNVTERCSDWIAVDSDDNSASNATQAAPDSGQSHYVTGISGGYSGAVAGALLQLKDDTTVIATFPVHNSFSETFPSPIQISAGKPTTATLAASGSGGVVGYVNLIGYTK